MMNAADQVIAGRAGELRRAFDDTFAEAQHVDATATVDLLAVTVGGDPHALSLSEIAGLHADRRITTLPSPVAELRGVAGFRGDMVPVYDLAALTGYARSSDPRWIVIAKDGQVAFAFEHLDGHLRVAADSLVSRAGDSGAAEGDTIVHAADANRRLVHLAPLIATIRSRLPAAVPSKEQ